MPEFPDDDSRNPLAVDCQRCPALVDAREWISWGNGPADAELVVVGEAPGTGNPDADRWQGGNWTGMAYTSRHSGRRVRELLADVGYPDAYYTNAVKCLPSDGGGGNREPTPEERANCRPYLREEIAEIDPHTVVTTGKHATTTTLALEGIDVDGFVDAVLEPVDCPVLGVTVLPIFQPRIATSGSGESITPRSRTGPRSPRPSPGATAGERPAGGFIFAPRERRDMNPHRKAALLWGAVGGLSFLVLIQGYELATSQAVTVPVKLAVAVAVFAAATVVTDILQPRSAGNERD